jgi:hypothetical protein
MRGTYEIITTGLPRLPLRLKVGDGVVGLTLANCAAMEEELRQARLAVQYPVEGRVECGSCYGAGSSSHELGGSWGEVACERCDGRGFIMERRKQVDPHCGGEYRRKGECFICADCGDTTSYPCVGPYDYGEMRCWECAELYAAKEANR